MLGKICYQRCLCFGSLQDAPHCTAGEWYDEYISQVLLLLKYYLIAVSDFFLPSQRFLYSMYGSNVSAYERENENVFIFSGLLLDMCVGTLES